MSVTSFVVVVVALHRPLIFAKFALLVSSSSRPLLLPLPSGEISLAYKGTKGAYTKDITSRSNRPLANIAHPAMSRCAELPAREKKHDRALLSGATFRRWQRLSFSHRLASLSLLFGITSNR